MTCLVLAGCASAPQQITVQSVNTMGPATTGTAGNRYVLRYANPTTQALIVPLQTPLLEALAAQGYRPATRSEAPDVVVWIAAIEAQTLIVPVGAADGPPVVDNPDSIRHKNVAAMFGRYKRLLNDDPNQPGEAVMGPEGEIIMTGNLASPGGEEVDYRAPVFRRNVARQRTALAIWARETRDPTGPDDTAERWRVEVVSELPARATPPTMAQLVATAATHLGRDTAGPQQVDLPTESP